MDQFKCVKFSNNHTIIFVGLFIGNDLKNLVEESLLMSNMDHPNVMKLLGVCIDKQTPYLVMPYMSQGSLLSYLKKNRDALMADLNEEDPAIIVRNYS